MSASEEEANDRLAQARKQKVQFELDLREGYAFAAPHRARGVLSKVEASESRPAGAARLNTSFAFELCADFPTVIINTFLPESEAWAKRSASGNLPPEVRQSVNEAARAGDEAIFKAISTSNFYAACGVGFNPDLALGTVGLWIDREFAGGPIVCQPIPIRELEINSGPRGGIDDRFICRWTSNRHLPTLTRGLPLPRDIQDAIKNEPNARTNVTWGFWYEGSAYGDKWCHVVLIKDKLIHTAELTGKGSCPLIVGRFNPSPEWAWGEGPLIQALPDLRHLDALAEMKILNLDLGLAPPITWPDDSWANISEGIATNHAYAVRPGSEGAVKNIYTPNPPQAAVYERADLEQRLRRLFFLDWPQQTGDTPPTATQWLDEMTMAQRRIGGPGRVFWQEFNSAVFNRFRYLLEKDGTIQPITIAGKGATLEPYNPAQRASDQQEVAQFTRFAQIGGAVAPEEFKIHTDGVATLENLSKRLGAERIWVKRDPEQIKAALAQIQSLQGGQAPTAPVVQPPGSGPPADLAGSAPKPVSYKGSV